MVNFTQCAIDFIGNPLYANYSWHGPVRGIQPNSTTQISYQGCKAVCGTGNAWYPWSQSSSTITTWLLPVIGMLLQAPFESNIPMWKTVLVITRWIGSPISSLSYLLWNISVSGKCALMVDMAVGYKYGATGKQTNFSSIRDSFYILITMNQYTIKPVNSLKKEAEGLLRIALFSKDLRLHGTTTKLNEMRQDLAQSLRRSRRRGVVPVFISTMWFLFSLGISIQSAFGFLGENATAHDLALGFLLGWLPILVLCSIVDRNPLSAEDVRERINELVDLVCLSLKDEDIVNEFIMSFAAQPEADEMKRWVDRISSNVQFLEGNFFESFAGQGRVRWHYGAAHPILSDIENCYIAEHGRDWLRNEPEARTKLVLGSVDRGLFWFDFRELWQISNSVIIVVGNCLGAFILSYFTPTVGLGCRSLGYLIFSVISFCLLVAEFLVWWFTSEEREEHRLRELETQRLHSFSRRFTITQNPTFVQLEERSNSMLRRAKSWGLRQRERFESEILEVLPTVLSYLYRPSKRQKKRTKIRNRLKDRFDDSHGYTARQWWNRLFFIPIEIINTIWLCYIVLAQTFGAYTNCRCKSSLYGLHGGYLDLLQTNDARNRWVKLYWSSGTTVSCTIMGVGLVYVVIEWCMQSHLSTENPNSASKGLQRTRSFRLYTYYARRSLLRIVVFINSIRDYLFRKPSDRQKTLMWTKDVTFSYATDMARRGTDIELSEYGTPRSPPAATFSPTFNRYHFVRTGSQDATDAERSASMHVPLIVGPEPSDELHDPIHPSQYPTSATGQSLYDGISAHSPASVSGNESGHDMTPPSSPSQERLRPRPAYHRHSTEGR